MRYSRDGTERTGRLARGAAAVLLVVAAVCLTAAWALHERTDEHVAAVRGDNPADLVLVPSVVGHTAPSGPARSTAPDRALTPTHLYIGALHIDTSVSAAPTRRTHDPFLHRTVDSFGVPDDLYTTTWWSSGPKPGSSGMAVILGHTQIGGYGVFNDLGSLHTHNEVTVIGAGQVLRFVVVQVRTGISKTDPYALRKALSAHPADAGLALITCSGTFDRDYDQSAQNTVAFAKLIT